MGEIMLGALHVNVRTPMPDGSLQYTQRKATPAEIAAAFWSLWWDAGSKPTPDMIEAVQTACETVKLLMELR